MLVYFMPISCIYILSNLKIKKNKSLIEKITAVLLGFFLCFTYFNGSDWRQYELMYKYVSFDGIGSFYAEKGFYLYMLLFKILRFNFWWFFIITKLWCFYIFYLYIKENSRNIFFTLMLFYYMSLYLFIDCPLRNLIAMAIFIFSIKYLFRKKYFKYYLLAFIAFSFHHSAIFMILLPFVKLLAKLNRKMLIFFILILNIIFLKQEILVKLISFFPDIISHRIIGYMNSEYFNQSFFSLGNLEKLFILFIILWNKEKIMKKNKNSKFIFSMLIVYYIFYRLAFTIEIIGRFSATYFYIFYILNIVFLLNIFTKNLNRKIIIFLFFIYGNLIVYKTINYSYKYLPYTTYLTYIFKEKPSYEFRSKYNILVWEERFGKKFNNRGE